MEVNTAVGRQRHLEADVITKDVVRLSVDMRQLPHKGEDRLLRSAELRLHGANSELDHRIVPSRYSPELREQVLGSTDSRLGLAGENELFTRRLCRSGNSTTAVHGSLVRRRISPSATHSCRYRERGAIGGLVLGIDRPGTSYRPLTLGPELGDIRRPHRRGSARSTRR